VLLVTHFSAIFDLAPASPVLKFWQNSGPFDVYLKLPQILMFGLVVGLFAAALVIPFQKVEPVPADEVSEAEQLAAYGEVITR
jgi:hypothetical protein